MAYFDIEHQKGERVIRVCDCGRKLTYNMVAFGLTNWEAKKSCCVKLAKELKEEL